jgi:hypothetical protein
VSNGGDHVGATVENGTIQQFGGAVTGGFSHSVVRQITLRDNLGAGVSIGAPHPLSDDLVAHNLASGNGCNGIKVTGVDGAPILNNRANGTTGSPESGGTGIGVIG